MAIVGKGSRTLWFCYYERIACEVVVDALILLYRLIRSRIHIVLLDTSYLQRLSVFSTYSFEAIKSICCYDLSTPPLISHFHLDSIFEGQEDWCSPKTWSCCLRGSGSAADLTFILKTYRDWRFDFSMRSASSDFRNRLLRIYLGCCWCSSPEIEFLYTWGQEGKVAPVPFQLDLDVYRPSICY